jgi:CRISPR-associated endonuclease/helicase Cas3
VIPLAHSARPVRVPPVPAQPYAEHVLGVGALAVRRAEAAARYTPYRAALVAAVRPAAEYHDLGKLDPANQAVLACSSRDPLPIAHEDAGVAHLLARRELAASMSALLVHAHHRGLPLLNPATLADDLRIREARAHTDANLGRYLREHRACAGSGAADAGRPPAGLSAPADGLPLFLRIALSCLVDADHSDTARNYGDPAPEVGPPLHAAERLDLLDRYVAGLAAGSGPADHRAALRREIYRQCRDGDPGPALRECDAPVGSGKTTAVMAHLLHAARTKGLRRVVVVLPFTNIIDQSVEVYRRALALPGEDPERVVAAHHHRAELEAPDGRLATYLWRAPIVVTTAVQFFETLAGCGPARLRKLHELPGSAIFLDESHACLRTALWPTAWRWLRQLGERWGCHVVLGSGSLNRVWELPEIEPTPVHLPPLVPPSIREASAAAELRRVRYRVHPRLLSRAELVDWLRALVGPRLLIVNTVRTAAAIARELAEGSPAGRAAVEHLSTALAPVDRAATLERVRRRLRDRDDRDWTLVGTSCIESGVNLSFRTGARERASAASLLQTAGRVNRDGEWPGADVWDIRLRPDGLIVPHPDFEASRLVLGQLFAEDAVHPGSCTEALRRELRLEGLVRLGRALEKAERGLDFPEVTRLFRVVDSETCTVVVDRGLGARLRAGLPIGRDALQRHSVQLWADRIDQLALEAFPGDPDLYDWADRRYDEFLGCMAHLLDA